MTKASDPQALLDDKGKPVIRPYTPISQQNEKGNLRLLVKEYPVSSEISAIRIGQLCGGRILTLEWCRYWLTFPDRKDV